VRVYVEFFRGVSAIILLIWVFYALPLMGVELTPMQAGVLALGLNLSAYGTEVVRGAVQAVPQGQTEAAIAVHLSPFQRLRHVVLPQAFTVMLPPYGNLVIEAMKASALVSLITVSDLLYRAQTMRNNNVAESTAIFVPVLLMYFAISLVITAVVRLLERRFGRGLDTGPRAGQAVR
jgi:polar amino acid transport system permease protein